jgi:hypothetical protein
MVRRFQRRTTVAIVAIVIVVSIRMPPSELATAWTHRESQVASVCSPAAIIVRAVIIVFDTDADPKDFEHPCCSTSKDDDGHDDHDEDRRSQGVCVIARDTGREGDTDGSPKSGPEEHHLIRMGNLLVPLASSVENPVDQL